MPNNSTAVFIGRFQPPHRGHLRAIQRSFKKFDRVIILVGSSQFSRNPDNPLSYRERARLLKEILVVKKSRPKVIIQPLPDVFNEAKWVRSVLKKVPSDAIVYTNNARVKKLLQKSLVVRPMVSGIRLSATQIRNRWQRGDPSWKTLVPPAVYDYVRAQKIDLTYSGF